jgi:hypothetical protein
LQSAFLPVIGEADESNRLSGTGDGLGTQGRLGKFDHGPRKCILLHWTFIM